MPRPKKKKRNPDDAEVKKGCAEPLNDVTPHNQGLKSQAKWKNLAEGSAPSSSTEAGPGPERPPSSAEGEQRSLKCLEKR